MCGFNNFLSFILLKTTNQKPVIQLNVTVNPLALMLTLSDR